MTNNRACKKFLAVAVLAAISGSTVWAADEVSTTANISPASTAVSTTADSTATATAVSAEDAAAQEAISAARGGIEEAQKSDAMEAKRVELDNSSLATKDRDVLMVANAEGSKLQEQQAAGMQQAVNTADARYYSGVTDEELQPYVGKVMTGFTIEGLPADVQDEYLALLKSHVGDTLTINAIRTDIAALGATGFLSEVNPVITVVPEGVKVAYKVTINPVVKSVQFSGNTVYSSEMLTNYLNVQPGSVLNTVQVGERIQGINAAYSRDGYILAHVNDLNVDENGVLHISITEGIVEDIVPHGNKKTKDYVILREFNQKKGQPFNKFLVRRSVEKVYNLGYFDDVNVRLLEGSTPDQVVIEIDVLEHKTGTITLGAGYSDSDGFVGIIKVGEDNLRGTGDKVKVHWEFGGTAGYKNYSVSYLRPWIDDKGTSLGVTIFDREDTYTDYNSDGDEISQYVKTQKGLNVSLGRQTGEYTRDYLTLESRKDGWKFDEDENSGYNYAENAGPGYDPEKYGDYQWDNGKYNFKDANYIENNFGRTNSVTWQKVYDSRDNIYDPKRGKRFSTSIQWAGHGLGGDFDFYKFTGEYRSYKRVFSDHVIAFRARVGWAQGDVPYSMLYTLGGADTLRGFEDDQFRGKKMYNATLEYRVPIFNKVTGVVFTDMGDAWDAPNVTWYEDDKSFNISVGAGVRISTPIGPIRLDYGVSKDDSKFHFSFGGQF